MKSSYLRPIMAVFLAIFLAACSPTNSGETSPSPTGTPTTTPTASGETSSSEDPDEEESPTADGQTAGGLAPAGYPSGPPNYPSAPGADLKIWVHSTMLEDKVEEAVTQYEEATGADVTLVVEEDSSDLVDGQNMPTYDVLITELYPQVVWGGQVTAVDYQGQEERFYPAALDLVRVGDELYGVPFNVEVPVLIRNTTYVPNPPHTWAELVNAGGSSVPSLIIQSTTNNLATLASSFGVMHAPAGSTKEEVKAHGLSLEHAEDYATWVQENINTGEIFFLDEFLARLAMMEGNAKAVVASPRLAEKLLQQDQIKFQVSPIPQIGDQPTSVITTGPGAFILKDSAHQAAAADLIFNYLTTDDFLIRFGFYFMPATYSGNVKFAERSQMAQAALALARTNPVLVAAPEGWVWRIWHRLQDEMSENPETAHDLFMHTMTETDQVLREGAQVVQTE